MRPKTLLKSIILALAIAAAGVAVVNADEPIPAKPSLVFPGVAPTPAAPVLPDAVTTLLPSQLYVVTSDQPFLLLASPARMVTITQEQGPIKIRATFADGSGKLETRTYAAKYVAIVEAASDGRVELLGVPAGVTDESEITRRLIDCGKGPIPPPDVEPEPEPDVPPGPQTLRVIMAFESSAPMSREHLNTLHSTAITAWLNEHCTKGPDGRAGWRKWDQDVVVEANEDPEIAAIWKASKSQLGTLPRLIVAAGTKVTVMDFEATESATLDKLKGMVK